MTEVQFLNPDIIYSVIQISSLCKLTFSAYLFMASICIFM